jgi:uncharacterized protein (TIGR02231 family)
MDECLVTDGDQNRVRSCVLFSEQAYVTREASCTLEKGLQRISLELGAIDVDGDSAQARVFGAGEILSVQYQERPTSEHVQSKIQAMIDERLGLGREKALLEGRKRIVERGEKLLESVASFSKVQVPQEIQTHLPEREQLQQLLEFIDENGNGLLERERKLNHELERVDREMDRLAQRARQLRAPAQRNRKQIEILFDAAEAGKVRVEASYLVGRVSWKPVYKVDVPLELTGAELVRFASIVQNSGEDWADVELVLSDALPSRSGVLPQPRVWRLRAPAPVSLPPMAAGGAPEAAMASADFSVMEQDLEEDEVLPEGMNMSLLEEPEAEYAVAEKRASHTAFEYQLPMPVSLPSDQADTLLPIERSGLEGEFRHYCVPRSDPLAYLVFAIQPGADWLPGRINIHMAGRYVGHAQLSERQAGEELLLNLGPDRGVKLELEKATDKLVETFFGKVDRNQLNRELVWRVRAENLKPDTLRLWVHDSLPVSSTDRFQVKGVEISPKPDERDWHDKEGVLLWKLEIRPSETRELMIGYTLHYPRDNPPVLEF